MNRASSRGYMVKGPNNLLAVSHGAWATKAKARYWFMKHLSGDTWKNCYAQGYRVVIVHITEQL